MALLGSATAAPVTVRHVEAVGSAFRVTLSDGRNLGSADLVGAVLSIPGPSGVPQRIRIEGVETDPADPEGEAQLHALSIQDPRSGAWTSYCDPGPDGLTMAFPMSGSWTGDGRHLHDGALTLVCTGGAVGKCVRWGYKPWRSAADGTSLWDYHQACVRMVRADYGGDGVGHTRNGTPIDLFDRLGIQKPASDPGVLTFEAAWGIDGALCVRKPRIGELASLGDIERQYPRLRGRTGDACRETGNPAGALIFNRS